MSLSFLNNNMCAVYINVLSIFTRIDLIYDLYYIWFKLLHLIHILIMIANTYL